MPNGPNDWTTRDRVNAFVVQKVMTPTIGVLCAVILAGGGWIFKESVIGGITEAKQEAKLASQESKENAKDVAVLKEAVTAIKGDIAKQSEATEQMKKNNTDILKILIDMNKKPPR